MEVDYNLCHLFWKTETWSVVTMTSGSFSATIFLDIYHTHCIWTLHFSWRELGLEWEQSETQAVIYGIYREVQSHISIWKLSRGQSGEGLGGMCEGRVCEGCEAERCCGNCGHWSLETLQRPMCLRLCAKGGTPGEGETLRWTLLASLCFLEAFSWSVPNPSSTPLLLGNEVT